VESTFGRLVKKCFIGPTPWLPIDPKGFNDLKEGAEVFNEFMGPRQSSLDALRLGALVPNPSRGPLLYYLHNYRIVPASMTNIRASC
jgi:hypothetical protein